MKRSAFLVWLAAAGVVLAGCTGVTTTPAAPAPPQVPHTSTTTATPEPATRVVPTDLVGKTLGAAKVALAKDGFTNVVVAGGNVTDEDKVASVPEAGQKLAPTARVRLIGSVPKSESSSSDSVAACWADESQCFMDGKQCATGSCVNAARGLSPADVQNQTEEWLSQHPGYYAAGQTGAVAPCSDGSTSTDPGFRDANGETKAEYCARTGQPLATCEAG